MNFVKKLSVFLLAFLLVGGSAFGATITASPSTVPINAHLDGTDGADHTFFITVTITFNNDGTGAWADDEEITVDLPSSMTIADTDNNGDYAEEVALVYQGNGADPGLTVDATTDQNTIAVNVGTAANLAGDPGGDIVTVLVPIETADNVADGATESFSNASTTGSDEEDSIENSTISYPSVTYEADQLELVTFAGDYSGGDKSSKRGKYYPTAETDYGSGTPSAITTQLPNFIDDYEAANTGNDVGGNFAAFVDVALDNDEQVNGDNADDDASAETYYTLWASQDSSLEIVNEGRGARKLVASDQPDAAEQLDAAPSNEQLLDIVFEGHSFAGTVLQTAELAEGTWYFYVTSNVTKDWALGRSGAVEIQHYPVFLDAVDGFALQFDLDEDGVYEYTNGSDDDPDGGGVAANDGKIVLESSGALDYNNLWRDGAGGTNLKQVTMQWFVEDVDDSAAISIFVSSNSGITNKTELLADTASGTGRMITPANSDSLYEEIYTGFTYDSYTDENNYEEAFSDYYVYVLADDGDTSEVYKANDADGTDIQMSVKHFPYLSFDLASMRSINDDGAGTNIDFNTAEQEYLTISWGNGANTNDDDGDFDADGDMTIELYISTDDIESSGYNANPDDVDASVLENSSNATLIATLSDTSDARKDNQYMFNLREANLADGNYYLYAVVSEGTDAQVIQLETDADDGTDGTEADGIDEADWNDSEIALTHGMYVKPKSPVANQLIEVKQSDQYTVTWKAFDKDIQDGSQTSSEFVVAILAVPTGTDVIEYIEDHEVDGAPATNIINDAGTAVDAADISDAGFGANDPDDWHWLTDAAANWGLVPGNPVTAADEKFTFSPASVTDEIDTDVNGLSGEYDLWFFYGQDADGLDSDDGFDESYVKANGSIFFNTDSEPDKTIEITPTNIAVEKGDTVQLEIQATDGGSATAERTVGLYLNVPSERFEVLDRDGSTEGVQPFGDNTVFSGTVVDNSIDTNGTTYELNFYEFNAAGDDIGQANLATIDTVFLVVKSSYTGGAAQENQITFSKSGNRRTKIVDVNDDELAVSLPQVASKVYVSTPGTIEGEIKLEGREEEGQVVDIFVCHEGSYEQISDSDFLTQNGLTSADDTIHYTLGAGGTYTINNVPTGTYDIFVHKNGYLNEMINSKTVYSLDATKVNFTGSNILLAGDVAGYVNENSENVPDNQIGSDDQNALNTAFGTVPGDDNWNVYADIDGDSTVDIDDIDLFTTNYAGTDVNGEGLLYKKVSYNGSNENGVVKLTKVSETNTEVVYSLKVENVANIHSYVANLNINDNDWEINEYNDVLSTRFGSNQFVKKVKGNYSFVSSIYGRNALSANTAELLTLSLRPKVDNPTDPTVVNMKVVDIKKSNTQLKNAEELAIPTEFSLDQNYPNPFNPTTNINYVLPEAGNIKLVVYDLLGNKVRTLVSNEMKPGHYRAVWNATNEMGLKVSSGVYFYRLMSNNKVIDTRKMVLMK